MTDLTPFVKSHPSVRVRQLLASAELDVPSADAKGRALIALAQLDHHQATTNFSGIALGTTVNRLIGAVTLYGSQASPWRLLARGSFMGAAAGALSLVAIVTLRWVNAPAESTRLSPAAQPLGWSGAMPTVEERDARDRALPPRSAAERDAREQALLQGAAMELDAGRAGVALQSTEALLRSQPSTEAMARATLLKAKALHLLGRTQEAETVAAPLLSGAPSPESAEWRAWSKAQHPSPAAPPAP